MASNLQNIHNIMNMEQKQEETDNTTKNLVHEIVRECNAHHIEISESFCTYYVKLLILDPHWKVSAEKKLNRIYIQSLVSFIIKKLQLKNSPGLAILRMQQLFRSQCVDKEILVTNIRELMRSVTEPLIDNVLHYVPDENNKMRLFKRIAMLLTFGAFIGHWKNMTAISKDTSTALKSIMDDREFNEFIEMKPEERLNQIYFLHLVVMGIRLFHHDSGRQLSDFQDMPKIIARDTEDMLSLLVDQIEIAIERLNLARSAIESVFEHKYEKDKNNPDNLVFCMKMKLPEGVTIEDVNYTFEFLAMSIQYEVYLRKILQEINNINNANTVLSKHNKEILTKLNSIIKFNIGIAATSVFPIFIELAQTWSKIQDEFLVLAVYLQLFKKISTLFLTEYCNIDLWKLMIGDRPTEVFVIKEVHISAQLKHCDLVHYEDYLKMEDELSFLGFCVWTFVETKGALIPGNPDMGVLRWKKNLYVFSVLEAAYIFDRDPEKFLKASYEIIRKKPELINLLNVLDNIFSVRNIDILCPKVVEVKKKNNNATQTELHPIHSMIDPNYIWNEWDLYKDATKLADISKCKTYSTQTISSHFKCQTGVQTTEAKAKSCQTKNDNNTNAEKLSNYIFGLRGYKQNIQHVIKLTRPVDEKPYHTCATTNPQPTRPHLKKCISRKSKAKINAYKDSSITTVSDQSKQTENVEDLNSCLCVSEI